jgi:ParB-like chromosome segregation protein Spo0J
MNYKIEYIDIEKVIPYEKNNQVHTEEDIKQLADMIERFGFDVPVIVDEDYVLIKGHKRRLAQMLRGEKKIMAIVRNDMSEEDKRAARIADNYVAKKAEWQFEYLTEEFNYFTRDMKETSTRSTTHPTSSPIRPFITATRCCSPTDRASARAVIQATPAQPAPTGPNPNWW